MHFAWTVLFLTAAGCSFSPNAVQQGDDDAGTQGSGTEKLDAGGKVYLDAPPKVYMDAKPCQNDVDHDGICDDNGRDDWLCGATKPTAPANSLELETNGNSTDFKISSFSINDAGTVVSAAPGTTVTVKFRLDATDTACSQGCIDQLEVGFDPTGHKAGCVFDAFVNKQAGVHQNFSSTGEANKTIKTPTMPGLYELRIQIAQNTGCFDDGHTDWYPDNVEPSDKIAYFCIR